MYIHIFYIRARLYNPRQLVITLLHFVQVGLSFALMLAVMTFNSYVNLIWLSLTN